MFHLDTGTHHHDKLWMDFMKLIVVIEDPKIYADQKINHALKLNQGVFRSKCKRTT